MQVDSKSARSSRHRALSLVLAALTLGLGPQVARADDQGPFPTLELGTAVEWVSVTRDPETDTDVSGFGARAIILSGSLIALLGNQSSRRFMIGDYYHFAIGAWYGSKTHIRVPLALGLQVGYLFDGDYQVVARAGIGGIGTSDSGGGYGSLFFEGRVRHEPWAAEVYLAPRRDSGNNSLAGVIGVGGRFYIDNFNVFAQMRRGTRLEDPPNPGTLTDLSLLAGIGIER